MYIYIHTSTYIEYSLSLSLSVCIYIYIHIYTYTYVCIYIYIYAYVYLKGYIFASSPVLHAHEPLGRRGRLLRGRRRGLLRLGPGAWACVGILFGDL